eukprot:5625085-Prymnesium_polylepis.1
MGNPRVPTVPQAAIAAAASRWRTEFGPINYGTKMRSCRQRPPAPRRRRPRLTLARRSQGSCRMRCHRLVGSASR